MNSIKLSVVIVFGLLAVWPAAPAHATPAMNSVPAGTVDDVAKWNKLNRRYMEAMANLGSPVPGGVWAGKGGAVWYTETDGKFVQKIISITAGGPAEFTNPVVFDLARGTITEVSGAITWVRRVTSEQARVFTLETLSVSGPGSDGLDSPMKVRVTPEVIEIFDMSDKLVGSMSWTSREAALAASARDVSAEPTAAAKAPEPQTIFEQLVALNGERLVAPDGFLDIYTVGDALALHYGALDAPRTGQRWLLQKIPGQSALVILEHPDLGDERYFAEIRGDDTLAVGGIARQGPHGDKYNFDPGTGVYATAFASDPDTRAVVDVTRHFYSRATSQAIAEASAAHDNELAAAAEEKRERRQDEAATTRALYDSLVAANAEADAHLAQTQAYYDATMAQAREQAAHERAQAEGGSSNASSEASSQDVANARAATERQYEIERQFQAEQARQAALRVEEIQRTPAAAPAGESTPAAATPTQQGPRMGFDGRNCEEARLGAQHWVGTDGTFEIDSTETKPDGWCHIIIKNWHSTGAASFQ